MNILSPKFKMLSLPNDVQLTIHFHSYETVYGKGSFVRMYKNKRAGMQVNPVMDNFCNHYGLEKIRFFINEVVQVGKVA